MDKASLRISYKKKRNELTDEDILRLDELILNQLKSLDWSSFIYVHCYLPIVKFKEFNTASFISWIWKNHPEIKIVISKSDFATQHMEHFIYDQNTRLVENSWGIPEPVNAEEINPDLIDAVVTPLLVADIVGNRVGYGKGFYDRFFSICQAEVQKIGISYFEPVSVIEDVAEWDIPLDVLLTPQQFYSF